MVANRTSPIVPRTVAVTVCATFLATAAEACFICDTVVTLDEASVACLEANGARYIAAAKAAPDQRTEVNLGICEGGRGIDGFPTVESLAESREANRQDGIRKVYFLELANIECLIANAPKVPENGVVEIDLASECG